jgi:hypothetical protein
VILSPTVSHMRRHITLAALVTVWLSGCYSAVPPIARGGPKNVELVTPYFDNQIKRRFPVGSDEEKLRAELYRESFRISETNDPHMGHQYIATYQESGVCKVSWIVRWNADQGKITNTTAAYTQTCL